MVGDSRSRGCEFNLNAKLQLELDNRGSKGKYYCRTDILLCLLDLEALLSSELSTYLLVWLNPNWRRECQQYSDASSYEVSKLLWMTLHIDLVLLWKDHILTSQLSVTTEKFCSIDPCCCDDVAGAGVVVVLADEAVAAVARCLAIQHVLAVQDFLHRELQIRARFEQIIRRAEPWGPGVGQTPTGQRLVRMDPSLCELLSRGGRW